jgi:hypothetical protein
MGAEAPTPADRVVTNTLRCIHMVDQAKRFAEMCRGSLEEKRERRKQLRYHILNAYLAILWAEDPVNDMKSIDAKDAYVKAAGIVTALRRQKVGEILVHPTVVKQGLADAAAALWKLRWACATKVLCSPQ